MSRITYAGPRIDRLRASLALYRISMATLARRLAGRRLDPSWGLAHEIGVRFWHHQFAWAMRTADPARMRSRLDSLQTYSDEVFPVSRQRVAGPVPGTWHRPHRVETDTVLLYFHGGGYAFDGYMVAEFADLIAARTGAVLLRADYRLTPEHPHPAQRDDALAAYRAMLAEVGPERLVLIGDSAGGHLVLMTLLAAREAGLPQPALAIGLSPWTDIGARGDSFHGNDRFDIVAGWMALRFGDWLTADRREATRAALSPVAHDFSGLAPLYLQAGGKEVLHDQIAEFAAIQAGYGAQVRLETWSNMTHDFFGYGNTRPEAEAALARIRAAVQARGLP